MTKPSVKTEMRTINADTAKQMLKKNANNRPLSKSHVAFLAKQMKEGIWVFDGQPIRFNGYGQLMDGQHRLNAIIESDTEQTILLVHGLKDEAFKVMDTGKTRNASDVFAIEGIKNANATAAATRIIHSIKKGIYAPHGMNSFTRPSNTELLAYFKEHTVIGKRVKDSQQWYLDFGKLISQSQIAAYHYLMAEKSVTHSETFWRKVMHRN